MVVAHQVKHAVQHQDADFLLDGVAEFARLRAGAASGDGDVAEERAARAGRLGREREDVGGVVLAAEVAVQAAQFGVAGDQHVEGAALGDFLSQVPRETLDRARAASRGGRDGT